MNDLWKFYEADKRILGFSPRTIKAYSLQLKMLIVEFGDVEIEEVTLNLLKEYLAKQSEKLKPSILGHRIRFVRSLFRFTFEEGCCVEEVHKLSLEDINWENCSAIVNGKGSKQREIYFTTECKVWLKRYLMSREDSCKALFVTETHPTRRMAIPTISWSLKKLANRWEVAANVYPHRFRHTFACHLLDNGAPLEFIQGMLGHEKASTT